MKNIEMSKLPRILVEYGEMVKIARLLDTNRETVRYALKGDVLTPLGLRIRKLAIERGGVIQDSSKSNK